MKKTQILSLIFVYILCFIIQCSDTISKNICGKWVIDSSPETLTMEFLQNGQVISMYAIGVTLEGTWSGISDTSVTITLDAWNLIGIIKEKNTMLLKQGDNEKMYRKVE